MHLELLGQVVAIAGALVTIFGLPTAIYGIISSNRNTQRSIDIQIVTTLALRFQDKWEREWRGLIDQGVPLEAVHNAARRNEFFNLLNWIDWLGILIEKKAFSDPALMLRSIEPSVRATMRLCHSHLNSEGSGAWPGVFEVAGWLGYLDAGGDIKKDL